MSSRKRKAQTRFLRTEAVRMARRKAKWLTFSIGDLVCHDVANSKQTGVVVDMAEHVDPPPGDSNAQWPPYPCPVDWALAIRWLVPDESKPTYLVFDSSPGIIWTPVDWVRPWRPKR